MSGIHFQNRRTNCLSANAFKQRLLFSSNSTKYKNSKVCHKPHTKQNLSKSPHCQTMPKNLTLLEIVDRYKDQYPEIVLKADHELFLEIKKPKFACSSGKQRIFGDLSNKAERKNNFKETQAIKKITPMQSIRNRVKNCKVPILKDTVNQEEQDCDMPEFVFSPKTYRQPNRFSDRFSSHIASLTETFKEYEQKRSSQSRSRSKGGLKQYFGSQTNLKSQSVNSEIFSEKKRIRPMKTLVDPASSEKKGNFEFQYSEAREKSRSGIFQNAPQRIETVLNPQTATNFSFQNQQSTSGMKKFSSRETKMDTESKIALHTIEEVQESIRSIKLPQEQGQFSISHRIEEHFQEIKANMLKQLMMTSPDRNEPQNFEAAKMVNSVTLNKIIAEIQEAAQKVVHKYNQQSKVSSDNPSKNPQSQLQCTQHELVKEEIDKVRESRLISKEESHVNYPNQPQSVLEPMKRDICEQSLQQRNVLGQTIQSHEFLKEGLIQVGTQKLRVDHQKIQTGPKADIRNIDDSFAFAQDAINSDLQVQKAPSSHQIKSEVGELSRNKSFKYIEQKNLEGSSISSISEKSVNSIKEEKIKEQNQNSMRSNKDSLVKDLQNLNKFTFLKKDAKAANFTVDPLKVKHQLQSKELDPNLYQVTQELSNAAGDQKMNRQSKGNVFTVKYAVNITNSSIKQQNTGRTIPGERKATEVVRLSPFKFRRKEEVVQEMVKTQFISKESESIIR